MYAIKKKITFFFCEKERWRGGDGSQSGNFAKALSQSGISQSEISQSGISQSDEISQIGISQSGCAKKWSANLIRRVNFEFANLLEICKWCEYCFQK